MAIKNNILLFFGVELNHPKMYGLIIVVGALASVYRWTRILSKNSWWICSLYFLFFQRLITVQASVVFVIELWKIIMRCNRMSSSRVASHKPLFGWGQIFWKRVVWWLRKNRKVSLHNSAFQSISAWRFNRWFRTLLFKWFLSLLLLLSFFWWGNRTFFFGLFPTVIANLRVSNLSFI